MTSMTTGKICWKCYEQLVLYDRKQIELLHTCPGKYAFQLTPLAPPSPFPCPLYSGIINNKAQEGQGKQEKFSQTSADEMDDFHGEAYDAADMQRQIGNEYGCIDCWRKRREDYIPDIRLDRATNWMTCQDCGTKQYPSIRDRSPVDMEESKTGANKAMIESAFKSKPTPLTEHAAINAGRDMCDNKQCADSGKSNVVPKKHGYVCISCGTCKRETVAVDSMNDVINNNLEHRRRFAELEHEDAWTRSRLSTPLPSSDGSLPALYNPRSGAFEPQKLINVRSGEQLDAKDSVVSPVNPLLAYPKEQKEILENFHTCIELMVDGLVLNPRDAITKLALRITDQVLIAKRSNPVDREPVMTPEEIRKWAALSPTEQEQRRKLLSERSATMRGRRRTHPALCGAALIVAAGMYRRIIRPKELIRRFRHNMQSELVASCPCPAHKQARSATLPGLDGVSLNKRRRIDFSSSNVKEEEGETVAKAEDDGETSSFDVARFAKECKDAAEEEEKEKEEEQGTEPFSDLDDDDSSSDSENDVNMAEEEKQDNSSKSNKNSHKALSRKRKSKSGDGEEEEDVDAEDRTVYVCWMPPLSQSSISTCKRKIRSLLGDMADLKPVSVANLQNPMFTSVIGSWSLLTIPVRPSTAAVKKTAAAAIASDSKRSSSPSSSSSSSSTVAVTKTITEQADQIRRNTAIRDMLEHWSTAICRTELNTSAQDSSDVYVNSSETRRLAVLFAWYTRAEENAWLIRDRPFTMLEAPQNSANFDLARRVSWFESFMRKLLVAYPQNPRDTEQMQCFLDAIDLRMGIKPSDRQKVVVAGALNSDHYRQMVTKPGTVGSLYKQLMSRGVPSLAAALCWMVLSKRGKHAERDRSIEGLPRSNRAKALLETKSSSSSSSSTSLAVVNHTPPRQGESNHHRQGNWKRRSRIPNLLSAEIITQWDISAITSVGMATIGDCTAYVMNLASWWF